mgnify:CR=1 FL=1
MANAQKDIYRRNRFSREHYASEEERRKAMFRQASVGAACLSQDEEDRESLEEVQQDFDNAVGDGLDESW